MALFGFAAGTAVATAAPHVAPDMKAFQIYQGNNTAEDGGALGVAQGGDTVGKPKGKSIEATQKGPWVPGRK